MNKKPATLSFAAACIAAAMLMHARPALGKRPGPGPITVVTLPIRGVLSLNEASFTISCEPGEVAISGGYSVQEQLGLPRISDSWHVNEIGPRFVDDVWTWVVRGFNANDQRAVFLELWALCQPQ